MDGVVAGRQVSQKSSFHGASTVQVRDRHQGTGGKQSARIRRRCYMVAYRSSVQCRRERVVPPQLYCRLSFTAVVVLVLLHPAPYTSVIHMNERRVKEGIYLLHTPERISTALLFETPRISPAWARSDDQLSLVA